MGDPVTAEELACRGCGAPVAGVRCEACGAAVRVRDYAVERILAENTRGRVYVCRTSAGRRVVLKELVFSTVPSAQHIDAFEREAGVLSVLKHPQIPRFLDSFRDGEGAQTRFYLVQELVKGTSLLARLEQGRFEDAAALEVARQVLGILQYIHGPQLRLLHRDIKPANLIVDEYEQLWLVDFGSSRLLSKDVTHHATIVGTYGYMAPEQLGGTADATTDLYALGCTLIHLLSGRAPSTLLTPDMGLDFEPYIRVWPTTLRFLKRLVARDRRERFKSATDALAFLDHPETAPETVRASRGFPVAAVVVALLGAVIGIFAFRQKAPVAQVPAAPAPPFAFPAHTKVTFPADIQIAGPFTNLGTGRPVFDHGVIHDIDLERKICLDRQCPGAEAVFVHFWFEPEGEREPLPDEPAAYQAALTFRMWSAQRQMIYPLSVPLGATTRPEAPSAEELTFRLPITGNPVKLTIENKGHPAETYQINLENHAIKH